MQALQIKIDLHSGSIQACPCVCLGEYGANTNENEIALAGDGTRS